jgi:hypothetical protein
MPLGSSWHLAGNQRCGTHLLLMTKSGTARKVRSGVRQ